MFAMSPAEMLELLARGMAVGAFVGLALVMARGLTPARLTGALFCLAAAAHTLTQLPQSATALGWAWPPIWALSVMGAGLFWAAVPQIRRGALNNIDRLVLTGLYNLAPQLLDALQGGR
jgi:hypothetical protein